MGYRTNVTHGIVVAQTSFASEETEVGKIRESSDARARQDRRVPEETESKEAVEPREAGKTFVGERAVEQQVIRFRIGAHQRVLDVAAMPGLEDRELVQERKRRVGHPTSGFETPKLGLASEGANHAVAGMRAEQVHALQLVAELQVRHAGVRDALLPAHLELPELGQMAEYFESAVGDPPAPRLAQIELLEPGQPRQVRETVVGQLLRIRRDSVG